MATGVTGKATTEQPESATAYAPHTEPIPLPDDDAIATLSYPGKATEEEVLRPYPRDFERISDSAFAPVVRAIEPNAVVWADNFFALNNMLGTHGGKVDLVYLDPPFCTGFDFQSRALRHAYKDQMSPTSYVEFMRRRLILLRELLAASGAIYLHIGYQMLFHLKVVMDEVFGSKNFRNLIVRRKCSSKNYTRKQYPNLHDYILFYSKSDSYRWNRPTTVPTADWLTKEYPKEDSKGRYKLVPVHAPGVRAGATGEMWRGLSPPPGKHWQYTPERLDEFDRRGEIHWSKNGNPRRKVYLPADKGIALTDYWGEFRDAHHQSIPITGYPTEKNLDMLKMIVRAGSDPGDLVLDPFCGSGTTLNAANDLERRWIGIDASIVAIEATVNRLRNGLEAMGHYVPRNEAQASSMELFADSTEPALPRSSRASFDLICDSELRSQFSADIQRISRL